MIKRLLALGLISGVLVAGGFAISGHVNHQSSKYQVLLSKHTQNQKIENNEFSATNGTYYFLNGNEWSYGLSPSGNSAVSIVYGQAGNGYDMSGVINGNGQSDYSPIVLGGTADSYLPNVSGPNTYEAGTQCGYNANLLYWYNEYNNSGAVQAESAYPLSQYGV